MEIRKVRVTEVVPYPGNPRRNDDAVEAVAESIRQCGYISPIVVDEDMVILAGHTRFKALKRLGWTDVEVRVARGLSEDQKRKYRVLDNKTGEFAEWDLDKLIDELDGLDFEGFDFGFGDLDFDPDDEKAASDRFFKDRDAYDADRAQDDDYDAFLEKFEEKHTTDDCYTPDVVYDAVADFVARKYGIDRNRFVRPFYPGGDYTKFKYKDGDVVVDNPPFSIEAEIIRWYVDRGIKFYLFAPALTVFSGLADKDATAVCANVTIIYENGAHVNTSFLTNLEPGIAAKSEPELYRVMTDAVKAYRKDMVAELPKYAYPDHVLTANMAGFMSRYGVEYSLRADRCAFTRGLDAQKEQGKAIFGAGFILSEKAAAEKAAAEKAAAEKVNRVVWALSDREREIVARLTEPGDGGDA